MVEHILYLKNRPSIGLEEINPGMVAYAYSPVTEETGAGGSTGVQDHHGLSMVVGLGQARPQCKTLSVKTTNKNRRN